MPGMGGTDILKVTQNSKKLSRIPVIIFSTSSSSHDQDLCYNLGALAFLSKPNSFNEVKKMAGMIVTMVRKTCNERSGQVMS
jgi:CheY-like chemotaxis protein